MPAREFKIETEMWVDSEPDRVYELLTEQMEIEAWWGEEGGQRVLDAEVDARPGGRYVLRIENRSGLRGRVRGEYMVLDPARQVVCTWVADWAGDLPSFLTFHLEPDRDGTRLIVTQRGFRETDEGTTVMGEPWNTVLEWLADYARRTRKQPAVTS